jgi:hypothetical protein
LAAAAILLLKKLKLMEKVRNFLLGIKDGFTTIWTMQDKWL